MGTLTIVRGEELRIQWNFKSDPTTPKNLTGYAVLIQIRPYEASSTLLYSWTEASPEVTFTASTGNVLLVIPQATTVTMNYNTAVMDCWVRSVGNPDGDRSDIEMITLRKGVSTTP